MDIGGFLGLNALKKKEVRAPADYVESFRNANLRFPQHSFPVDLLVADHLMQDPHFDPSKILGSTLGPEELRRLKDTMNTAHIARDIPAGTAESHEAMERVIKEKYGPRTYVAKVPDKRIQNLWRNTSHRTLNTISIFFGLDADFNPYRTRKEMASAVERLKRKLADPAAREHVASMFHTIARSLMSEKGDEYAAAIRLVNDNVRREGPKTWQKPIERIALIQQNMDALLQYVLDDFARNNDGKRLDEFIVKELTRLSKIR